MLCGEVEHDPAFDLPAAHPLEYAIDVFELVGTDRRLHFAGAGEVERFLKVEPRPDDRAPDRPLSSENMPPRPGTTSMIRSVCFHASY